MHPSPCPFLVMADMLCQGTMASVLSMTQPLHHSKVSAGIMRLNRKRGLGQEEGQEEGAAAQAADKRPRTAAEEMLDEGEKVVSKSYWNKARAVAAGSSEAPAGTAATAAP